jgi:hypothetical protein
VLTAVLPYKEGDSKTAITLYKEWSEHFRVLDLTRLRVFGYKASLLELLNKYLKSMPLK